MAGPHLQNGSLLPTEIILPLLKQKIEGEIAKGRRHFLVDGFPRTVAQGAVFEREVSTTLTARDGCRVAGIRATQMRLADEAHR